MKADPSPHSRVLGPRREARSGALAVWLAGSLLFASGVAAEEPEQAERQTIRIGIILASNDARPIVDPVAVPVRRRLEHHFHFSSYRMIQQVSFALAVNETGRVLLPDDTRLEVRPTAFEGSAVQMSLKIVRQRGDQQVVEISARGHSESYLVIGGAAHQNGILILVVSPGAR